MNEKFKSTTEFDYEKWVKKELDLFVDVEKSEGLIGEELKRLYKSTVALNELFKTLADYSDGTDINFIAVIFSILSKRQLITPVTDNDEWENVEVGDDNKDTILKNVRYPKLFRITKPSGETTYHDISRSIGTDVDGNGIGTEFDYYIASFVNAMHPITLPYLPPVIPYNVFYKHKTNNDGSVKYINITHMVGPNNEINNFNFYLKNDNGEYIHITEDEYNGIKEGE